MTAISPSEDKIQRGESPSKSKTRWTTKECEHEYKFMRIRRNGKGRNGNRKPMRFVSLHHHSTFSYLDGYQLPAAHIRRAQELQMGAIAFTEHGNVSGHVKAEIAAAGSGVRVLYGCELYTGKVGEGAQQIKNHLTVLAETDEGYQNLLQLVSRSYAEGFYYEPTVSWRMLNESKRGLLILSGCTGSLLFCSAVGGKGIGEAEASYQRALRVAERFKRSFGDAYYIEVQAFPELEKTRRANPILARIAGNLGIPLVATMDCHYTDVEEAEMQQILHNVRGGGRKTLEEQAREWGYEVPLCPPPNDKSIYRRLRGTGLSKEQAVQAIVSTEEIAQRIQTDGLPRLPLLRYPLPPGYESPLEVWRDWLRDGWRYRGCHRLPAAERKRYKERLAYEMSIIEEKDFVDYFLVVSDAVRWTKDAGIFVGPARGSAAASLVCWLLRITEVNPMLFEGYLVFERFIDITRDDLPDIDLDFPGESRTLIRDYLVGKYGENCVNNIGTFTYYKSKLALDDVARVHKIPRSSVERVKELLIERSSGDLRASATIEDTVEQFDRAREVFEANPELGLAMDLEGNIKGFGVHAAGLVISNGDIREVAAVYERKVREQTVQVISLDKYDAERQGLVKMDFLGLSTASQIWAMCKELGMTQEDLYDLPLDDEKVIDGFRWNDTVGIFQFDGRATRYVCHALKPDTFREICDVNALSRPGPLHNGAARSYAEIKHGKRRPEKIHPAVDAITEPTQYQIVYQEQILRIVREVGDFPWTHAAHIRRIISRKIGEQEFQRQWGRFWEGAQTLEERLGTPPMAEETARDIWGQMITAGSYAFNAAHSVSYGMLAYWTMYFKQYHPALYYSAALEHLNQAKHHDLIRDAVKHEVELRPPDPRRSKQSWRPVGKKAIRAGLSQVPGVGEKVANALIAYREENPVTGWWDYVNVKGIGPKTIEKIEAFAGEEDPFKAFLIDRNIAKVEADLKELKLPSPTHKSTDLPYLERAVEVTWLGTVLDRNVRDIFELNRSRKGTELDAGEVKDPHLNEWCLMTGEDDKDRVLLRVDRWRWPGMKQALFDMKLGHDLVLVQGIRPNYFFAREIRVKRVWVIEP